MAGSAGVADCIIAGYGLISQRRQRGHPVAIDIEELFATGDGCGRKIDRYSPVSRIHHAIGSCPVRSGSHLPEHVLVACLEVGGFPSSGVAIVLRSVVMAGETASTDRCNWCCDYGDAERCRTALCGMVAPRAAVCQTCTHGGESAQIDSRASRCIISAA